MKVMKQIFFLFFFNDTATTEIYTLSLHDALPIFKSMRGEELDEAFAGFSGVYGDRHKLRRTLQKRSEEHTSELQSRPHLVCRLLLEKKKIKPEVDDASGGKRSGRIGTSIGWAKRA